MQKIVPPMVMGILNVTPDSFSDGGQFLNRDAAIWRVRQMIDEGADIIDVGGESTRPGADPVPPALELDRVIPVIETIRSLSDIVISVDTSTPEVMTAAVAAGANLINDVRALRREGALAAAAETGASVCLMHMKGDPKTMQLDPHYDDLFGEVTAFFRERMAACAEAGIPQENILLDPGFGFGKTPEHNLQLINRLDEFACLDAPLLIGLSRKSTLGKVLGSDTEDRLIASVTGAVAAYQKGASVLRVHDVKETVQALRTIRCLMTESLI